MNPTALAGKGFDPHGLGVSPLLFFALPRSNSRFEAAYTTRVSPEDLGTAHAEKTAPAFSAVTD